MSFYFGSSDKESPPSPPPFFCVSVSHLRFSLLFLWLLQHLSSLSTWSSIQAYSWSFQSPAERDCFICSSCSGTRRLDCHQTHRGRQVIFYFVSRCFVLLIIWVCSLVLNTLFSYLFMLEFNHTSEGLLTSVKFPT